MIYCCKFNIEWVYSISLKIKIILSNLDGLVKQPYRESKKGGKF